MATITRVEFDYKKPSLTRDPKTGKYRGYQVDVRDGKTRRRNTFATKREAENFVDAVQKKRVFARAGVRVESNQAITLRKLFDARIAVLTERKQRNLETRVADYFCTLINPFTPVISVGVKDFRKFVETRSKDMTPRGTCVTQQTVDRELTVIAATFHRAGEYFDELENYIAPKIPHPRFKKVRRERVITDDERTAILAELYKTRPAFARIFEIASLTGIRHSEAMGLQKTDLNVKARALKVYRAKTDTVSIISPLTDRMIELLTNDAFTGAYIFTHSGKTPGTFYRYLKAACEAAGVPYGRYTQGGVVLHDTRHSFVSALQREGVDLATIASFSGHSTKEMVMRYSHAGPESRRRAMAVFEPKQEIAVDEMFRRIRAGEISVSGFKKWLKR